jgi:hypothetical protein
MNTIEILNQEVKTYKIGQMFLTPNKRLCLLAQVAPSNVQLIDLEDGNRMKEMYKVENVNLITAKELTRCDEDFPNYKPVDAKITVTI